MQTSRLQNNLHFNSVFQKTLSKFFLAKFFARELYHIIQTISIYIQLIHKNFKVFTWFLAVLKKQKRTKPEGNVRFLLVTPTGFEPMCPT